MGRPTSSRSTCQPLSSDAQQSLAHSVSGEKIYTKLAVDFAMKFHKVFKTHPD
jgi:hypothetical protein